MNYMDSIPIGLKVEGGVLALRRSSSVSLATSHRQMHSRLLDVVYDATPLTIPQQLRERVDDRSQIRTYCSQRLVSANVWWTLWSRCKEMREWRNQMLRHMNQHRRRMTWTETYGNNCSCWDKIDWTEERLSPVHNMQVNQRISSQSPKGCYRTRMVYERDLGALTMGALDRDDAGLMGSSKESANCRDSRPRGDRWRRHVVSWTTGRATCIAGDLTIHR